MSAAFSPPTRGWSVVPLPGEQHLQVLPADAAVVRSPPDRIVEAHGSPRRRGGGPIRGAAAAAGVTFSPPTRGWSVAETVRPGAALVLPADAGVVRSG